MCWSFINKRIHLIYYFEYYFNDKLPISEFRGFGIVFSCIPFKWKTKHVYEKNVNQAKTIKFIIEPQKTSHYTWIRDCYKIPVNVSIFSFRCSVCGWISILFFSYFSIFAQTNTNWITKNEYKALWKLTEPAKTNSNKIVVNWKKKRLSLKTNWKKAGKLIEEIGIQIFWRKTK